MLKLLSLVPITFHLFDFSNAWSPTDSYAPGTVQCPSSNVSLIRDSSSISEEEESWLSKRDDITFENLKKFLKYNTELPEELLDGFDEPIKIAFAFSGGGLRSTLTSTGQLAAFDNRTTDAFENGLGGLLDAVTYIAGISGASWLVTSLSMYNWTSTQHLIFEQDELWDLYNSILNFSILDLNSTSTLLSLYSVFNEVNSDLSAKKDAGFDITLTDAWGRLLSRIFLSNYTDYADSLTWSTLREFDVFKNAEMPFPIIIANGRMPDTKIINLNSTVFEVNPFEIGSWDSSLQSFADIKYLGSNLTNGYPNNNESCISGFDNTGFLIGTSSSLFNFFNVTQLFSTLNLGPTISTVFNDFLSNLGEADGINNDIAIYGPNPFYGSSYGTSKSLSESDSLYLVDGGLDNQNIPFAPFIQPERNVDVIFGFDNSANTEDNWPNGTSLIRTYQRQFGSQANATVFPYVPDAETFLKENLTTSPIFFGCDSSNFTNSSNIPPLIVYLANHRNSYDSNKPTLLTYYTREEKLSMVKNGFEISTNGNDTDHWPTCVGCAILKRSFDRNNDALPDVCEECFENYCYNYEVKSTLTNDTNSSSSPSSSLDSKSSSDTGLASGAKKNYDLTTFGQILAFFIVALCI
ncbi:uncharacterized protein ASCRUDRAFT_76275 [Ascoidea rubescens DSM 1968]|uniref:Lysophospholipase n=1 Tax=Ascoidea rubescens DSM 1968 TaxID=1344418 RepID=A0A1D2VF09_9ASCO|nr:hypothetical protein ASCRUDRAFT_76275 [Ascoidea rubescens DSM 1968]ODV60241.1 hypothetical protein ASCRUDRAFT_76275 [Ascoidea rubescens DSM 1968]